jgi:hypothetical protein
MDFLPKYCYGVFELPSPRNAQKGTKKDVKKNKYLGLVGSSEFNQIYVKVRRFCLFLSLSAPCPSCSCSCSRLDLDYKGPASKTKSVTPLVGGWVKVRKRDGVRYFFSVLFYRVFELPSPRNAQKRDEQKSRKKRFRICGRFFCTNFSTRCFFVCF